MSEEKHRIMCNLCRKAATPWFPSGDQADEWANENGWTFEMRIEEGEENFFDLCPSCKVKA